MLIHIHPNLRRETRPDAAPGIAALIDPASVIPNLRAGGKRQTLRALAAQAAAATGVPERAIFGSAPPGSATASPSRTPSCPASTASTACSPGWSGRSTSKPLTAGRSTSSS